MCHVLHDGVKLEVVDSLICRKIILLALLLNTGVCLGILLTISGSSSYAVLNESFTLTCTVEQADGLNDFVDFFRKTYSATLASVEQTPTGCAVFGSSIGYTASCGPGTGTSSSTSKIYTCVINSVADYDATDWWCELETSKQRSNNITVMFKVPDPNPESPVSESTIIIIVVVAVLLLVAIAVSWFYYKRMKQQPKSKEEQTENKTQEAEDEKGQHDK
ncbi:uncharacterized protein LOC121386083 [Gigantopelta aegis]|uniref:uncharacterized protein LOC121386083 n=1 Tax=Gigantopelta aegis TaxID=1735272 RepID=UPI001B8889E9|nr:uncharacterized protein LOC121386083 [Gigantopelta aegis]